MHILHRPAFILIDGYVNHWDADALELLVAAEIYVFFLKSQDSDNDQLNDNGPNGEGRARPHTHTSLPYTCPLNATVRDSSCACLPARSK
eukprot:5070534-Prymnesium_polylepis.1